MILHIASFVALAACIVSCAFWVTAALCLRSVLRKASAASARGYQEPPLVSVLKPVKGIDVGAIENFASFCQQNYPRFELLFGVADRRDPAVKVIDQLRERFPDLSIRLYFTDPLGANPKAAILHRLTAEARGEILVISDADIRVTPDCLARVVNPLSDKTVGLVTCLYRGELPANVPARLEALHMDCAFAPSVAMAWKLGTKVGLGAMVVMRRADLLRAGGYAGCADHLLDDYEVAARINKLGLRIHLSDYPVASVLGSMRFREQWDREVRWSRGIRVSGPARYVGMIITFTLPLALLTAAFGGVSPWACLAIVLALAVRSGVAWQSARLLQQRERRYLLWLPVRDLLSLAVWAVGLFGRTVTWRGKRFVLMPSGKLQPLSDVALPTGLVAWAVRGIDRRLRRRDGIFEFCDDPRCVLRVHVAAATDPIEFADGTRIAAGDKVAVLHLWNEHLQTIPREGADLVWAMSIRRAMQFSLTELDRAIENDPRLAGAKAFGGTALFASRNGPSQVARLALRYGFEFIAPSRRPTVLRRIHDFFENFLILGLQWTFNPAGMRGKAFLRKREPLWITRAALIARYGASASQPLERAEAVAVEN